MKHLFITDLFASLLKLLIPVFLLYFGYHYSGFLLGFLMSYSIFLFFRFDKNYFRHSNKKISYKQFFSYSVPALISFTTYYFLTYSPYLILPILQNIEISGVFALAFTVSSIFYVLSGVFTSALFPTTSELSTNHATKTRQGYFVTLTLRYILLVTLPAAFIFILFPDYIVLLFAKPAFLASTIYLQILVPAFLFFGIGSFFLSTIYGLGKPKIFRNIMIMTSLLFLVTSVLLTKYFSALGLSVTYFFTMLLCLSLSFNFLRKYTKIKIPSSDIAKILVASSFVMLLLFLSRSIISKLAIFILVLIPATLLYFLILLVLKFYRMEDIRVLEFFGRRVPFFGRYFLMISKFLKNKI
jgi:O-antigen/teichoic acid export membrane protein